MLVIIRVFQRKENVSIWLFYCLLTGKPHFEVTYFFKMKTKNGKMHGNSNVNWACNQ